MCGIFGFVANRTNNNIPLRKIADQLFILSESRGKEASGISTLTPTSINVLKLPLQASQLIKTKEYDEFWEKVNQTFSFLGHSRLATNGLQSENRNNQPVYSKRTVGVHNGMILNDVELWKKYPTFHRQSEVDTEVFIALFDYFTQKGLSLDKTIKRVYDLIQGAVSIALFLSDYPVIVLATNTGSLYYARTKSSFIFASERYILEQAIIKTKLDQLMPIDTIQHLTAGFACVVDKESLFIDAFSLKSNRKMKVNIKQYNKPLIVHNKTPDSIDSFYHSEDLYQNSLNKLSTHEPDYNAIKKLQRCTKCILPETMPY
ncbi:hypothetical protein HY357_00885, partial [Candidatus Roizmanbacteria bacterium]|nr:hypothetical protein [Candidatus Roizmanbacteria bacterium]